MTPIALTESLTLALKLKAEVERVCTLLDEKDARIAELERDRENALRAIRNCVINLANGSCLSESASVEFHCQAPHEVDLVVQRLIARIAALESELAAKAGYDTWMNAAKKLGAELDEERQECELKHAALMGCEETLRDVTGQRDRERSRREALEREVRGLVWQWNKLTPGLSDAGLSIGYARCAAELSAILDRAAEQDSTGSGSGVAGDTDGVASTALSPQSEPRRDYPPRTQAKPWFGDEFKPIRAEQDEPHTPDAEAEPCPDCLTPDGPTCPRCGNPRGPSGVDGGSWVHLPAFTGDSMVWRGMAAPGLEVRRSATEPRMSVSEAHLDGLLREARANVWTEAGAACAERSQWAIAQDFAKRAAAVRRGDALRRLTVDRDEDREALRKLTAEFVAYQQRVRENAQR